MSFVRDMMTDDFSVEAHGENKIAVVHKEGHRLRFHIAFNSYSRRIVSPDFQVIESKAAKHNSSPAHDIAVYILQPSLLERTR